MKNITGGDRICARELRQYNNKSAIIKANINTQNLDVIWNGFRRFSPDKYLHIVRTTGSNKIHVSNYQTQENIITIPMQNVYLIID